MEITLEKIELVKDRTGVSYKEAKEALEAADGSVVDAIIAIEETVDVKPGAKANAFAAETVAKIKDFVRKGNISKITVQKGDTTIVNVPVNVGVVGAIVAPWGMIAAAIAAFGFSCKITLTTTDGKHIDVSGKAENFASDMKEKGSVVFDGMMAKGTDVVNNVKEKAPIVANNVASEVAGTYDKIKDAAADKYNEFKAKKEACAEEADDDDEEWEEFCEKVEDFCDHISDAAGDMAATARYQGSGSSKVNATKEENILDEVKNAEGLVLAGYEQGYDRQGQPDEVLLTDAVALAKKDAVDVVLAVVGLDERSESEGLDRSTMAIPQAQNDLVTALAKTGKPVVIVLVAGSPVELPWFDDVAAMLYVGLSGQAGASATVRALTGEVNPSGHLAETWPMQYEDCPSSGWYPAIGRDAIYREGPFVGYRYYETVGVPVRFPFGYGLSYSTFTYSAITATATGVDFVVTNDSDVAGSTVAQLYVRAPQGGVLHPDRELKGFVKVELAAHESKSVHIDFDRYTFRHFDVAANAWKTESGEWTLLVGDNAEHLPLTIPHTVAGDCTTADCAADPALGHYLTGRVKDVTDAEMAVLFGHEVLAPGKPTTFGVNDPIMSWVDSKGFVARTVAKTLTKREAKIRQKTGSPDLNTLFILNMPPRAMSKMTQGMVDSAMVDAIVNIANGHTFRGLGGVIAGFFRNQSANKRTAKELNHD